ncbi:hypothetical protein POTOM_013165 [Populus tomentosa]|uniref:Uncharacterized protein n=1 Tax=Populus tomentosa TaxID=118781 RepID=A0A8X8A4A7_POPTO|nr:hypothetical protein POTOM_013165 [Populus tomentosa]
MEGGRFTAITQITPSWYDKIYASYKDDVMLQDIMRSKLVDAAQSPSFTYADGVVKYKGRVVIGSAGDISLWNDVWLIDSCLAVQFPTLYSLPEDQVSSIATAAVKASIQPATSTTQTSLAILQNGAYEIPIPEHVGGHNSLQRNPSSGYNHALLQSPPEASSHGYHFITAAQATQQTNYRVPEEGKNGGSDTSNMEGERKADMVGGQTPLTGGQSIVFSRLDLTDSSVSTMPVNNVVDSSVRTLNLGYTPARTSSPAMSATIGSVNAPSIQQQMQRNQKQQQQRSQQIHQLQKHQQFAAAASTHSETPTTSNGSVYSDYISSSSSMGTKLPNALLHFLKILFKAAVAAAVNKVCTATDSTNLH